MAERAEANQGELIGARIILRDKREDDAENDYRWRSDPELARLDAAIPLTMSYERYLKLFEDQMKYPTPGSHHYSIETIDGTFIGNCMYYDLDTVNREAELGIVIGDRDYWSDGYGYDAVTTLLEHMFTARDLKRVYLHTLEWNGRAQKSFSKSGFNPVKAVRRMAHDFILMDVLREDWFAKADERLAARLKRQDNEPSNVGSQTRPPGQTTAG
ncbi:MAG: GNAT family N-acetyltransferase [Chloroflexi bacterium]|nr:GNAT family N-acetyltransferase [Chloroflexota bacterium]